MSDEIFGVDLSYCQQGISYQALKDAGVRFAIIRAGFSDTPDSLLKAHYEGCRSMGIACGFYWYSYGYSLLDARREALACIKAVKDLPAELPVFYDIEEPSHISLMNKDTRTEMVQCFCEELKKEGITAGLYANPSFIENYYNKEKIIGKYPIWLAHWTGSRELKSRYNYGQMLWQYGTVNIGGMTVDADICFDTLQSALPPEENTAQPQPQPINPPPVSFEKGEKVRVKDGALTYYGKPLASFVYTNIYEVMQVGKSTAPDYIVIGQNDCVTAAVKAADLVKLKNQASPAKPTYPDCSELKTGDKVRIRPGSTTYFGKPLAAFVYTNIYEVMQVGTTSYPDYIVIGQDGFVTAAVKASALVPHRSFYK